MGLLSRLSDGFWSYMSPSKSHATQITTPKTMPRLERHAPVPLRRNSMKEVISKSRSMSPEERIDNWRKKSSTANTTGLKRKRQAPPTPSSGAGRRSKAPRMEDVDMIDVGDFEYDYSEAMMSGALLNDEDPSEHFEGAYEEEYYEEDSEMADDISHLRSPSSQASGLAHDDLKSPAVDETEVLSDDEYTDGTPIGKRKIISAEEAEIERGISPAELRAQGWDDDHITLVERLTLRGFEPVLPLYWKFNYPWLPEGLFCSNDDSFISSVKDEMIHSHRAFDDLLEMSSRIRDGMFYNDRKPIREQVKRSLPEQQGKKFIQKFTKWCDKDSGLDLKRAIPMLTIVAKPKEVASEKIQQIARKRLARYAALWKEAFRVRQSIEGSPVSRASTALSYPIPTLYAIIASYSLVAVVAYRPEDGPNADIKSVLLMDNKNVNYDFWNALAIALVVCHVRNVRVRIAEETGIGLKIPGMYEEPVSDPDL